MQAAAGLWEQQACGSSRLCALTGAAVSGCATCGCALTAPPHFLQALSEERASAIAQLQSQLDLANEKVAVLTAELGHLEQEGRQVRRQVAACKHTGLRAGACLLKTCGAWSPGVT